MSEKTSDLTMRVIDDGRIQLLDILGAGAFGTVYRALDCDASAIEPVFRAVKAMSVAEKHSQEAVAQAREMKFHTYLSGHPNIMRLHRSVKEDGYVFLIMDFCSGGSLYDVVIEHHCYARNDTLIKTVFLQIIDAVSACHQNCIYHRDLKLDNILVSPDLSEIYLTDFGLATQMQESRSFGTGTVYYMSPECFNYKQLFEEYDARRNDIWALGVLLVNIVTGCCPWRQPSPEDDWFREYFVDPSFLRQKMPISPDVEAILQAIFTEDPEDCVDLDTLRSCIVDVDSFYMNEEQLAAAPEAVKILWDAYGPPGYARVPFAMLAQDQSSSIMVSASKSSPYAVLSNSEVRPTSKTLHSVEEGNFVRRDLSTIESAPEDDTSSDQAPVPIDIFTIGSHDSLTPSTPPLLSSDPSPSSDDGSDSPATPESHAQDPDVVVPELSQELYLGGPMEIQKPTLSVGTKSARGERLEVSLVAPVTSTIA